MQMVSRRGGDANQELGIRIKVILHQQEGTLLANFRALFSAFSLVSQPTSRQVDKPEAKFSKFIISIYFK
jgi:hypothetical protein